MIMSVIKELPIDQASISRLVSVRVGLFNDMVDGLSERLYTGQISLGSWEETMKSELKALHTSTASLGKGWDNMTASDWGRVGQSVRQQYRYLHGFAEDIAENSDTLSLRAIQARARMYGNAAKHTAAVIQAGEFAGGTRRKPGRFKGLPWMPGDGSTQCLTNCKCHWELETIDKTKKTKLVEATWKLTPAEHCEDCINRDDFVVMLTVPLDTVVPAIIGGL